MGSLNEVKNGPMTPTGCWLFWSKGDVYMTGLNCVGQSMDRLVNLLNNVPHVSIASIGVSSNA